MEGAHASHDSLLDGIRSAMKFKFHSTYSLLLLYDLIKIMVVEFSMVY